MNPEGLLSHEQREAFGKWITEKAPLIGKCPVCGTRRWALIDHFVHLPIYRGGSIMLGGPAYPYVGLICDNCGNTQLVNAVKAGILTDNGGGSK